MTGIWEFPELAELEDFIEDGISRSVEVAVEAGDLTEFNGERIRLDRIIVVGDWGNGDAQVGQDPLRALLFYDFEGAPTVHLDPAFDPSARIVTGTFENLINQGEIEPPELAKEWFPGLDMVPQAVSRLDEQINSSLGQGVNNSVYDMTDALRLEFSEGVTQARNLPKTPLEVLRERAEEEEAEPEEPEQVEEPEPEPAPPTPAIPGMVEEPVEEPEEEEDIFPDVPDELERFAVDNETLEIPAGKETLQLEPREPYDFEVEMAKPGTNVSTSVNSQIMQEIGNSIGTNRFGNEDSPGTFPRTGVYMRNHLKLRGPSYAYQIYRDLVYYSGYISSVHDGSFKSGTYQSFRDFVYVVRQFAEEDELPTLIQPLSQAQASSRGLQTVPDHPNIEGEKAPWLERRQWYELVEENDNHEAWRNVYDFFYGDGE